MPRLFVDGMRLEGPIDVPGLADGVGIRRAGSPDWHLALERRPAGDDLEGVEWSGDVRAEGEPWARFGRRRRENVVLLEGAASLVASAKDRRAVIRHDGVASKDVAVLRRLSPYLASLSGRLALHAATVVFPTGAVLLCGEAGSGKSTLALALDARGVPVLADDHVVVDAPPSGPALAHASFPFVDVARASRRAFRPDAAAGDEDKASVPLRSTARPAVAPLVAVAFLARAARAGRAPVRPADAVARLLRDAVFVADPADDEAHAARLDACLRLVAAAPPTALAVPEGLDRLASALEEIAGPWGVLPS